jgi:hypothetical protein
VLCMAQIYISQMYARCQRPSVLANCEHPSRFFSCRG